MYHAFNTTHLVLWKLPHRKIYKPTENNEGKPQRTQYITNDMYWDKKRTQGSWKNNFPHMLFFSNTKVLVVYLGLLSPDE